MAVTVFDRHGEGYTYPSAESVELTEENLTVYDSDDREVGGFNAPAWSHYVIHADPLPGV